MVKSLIVGRDRRERRRLRRPLARSVLHDMPVETHLVVSKWGQRTLEHETGKTLDDLRALADRIITARATWRP